MKSAIQIINQHENGFKRIKECRRKDCKSIDTPQEESWG
jgi:hypothetical protein